MAIGHRLSAVFPLLPRLLPAAAALVLLALALRAFCTYGQLMLGLFAGQHYDHPAAVRHYKLAVAIDPANWRAWRDLGLYYGTLAGREGEPARSQALAREELDCLAEAAGRNPYDPEIFVGQSQALQVLNRMPEAVGAMRRAVGADPHHVSLQVQLAGLLDAAGRPEEALALFRQLERYTWFFPAIPSNIKYLEAKLQKRAAATRPAK